MGIFFQNVQNHGFWNFDFWFLSRGKKAMAYMNASTS